MSCDDMHGQMNYCTAIMSSKHYHTMFVIVYNSAVSWNMLKAVVQMCL